MNENYKNMKKMIENKKNEMIKVQKNVIKIMNEFGASLYMIHQIES